MGQIQLLGCGHACPAHAIDNQQLEKIIDTSDEWIVQRTGIHSRYVASAEETTSVLAARAARQAITAAGIDKKEIRLLIVATLSGDQPMPSTACLVQERLGMMDQPIMAFDLNAACSGFLYALQCAMLEEGACARCRWKPEDYDWSDAALPVGRSGRSSAWQGRIWHFAQSKGDPKRVLDIPGKTLSDVPCVNVEESYRYLHMDGREVFRFAVGAMEESIHRVLEKSPYALDDVDLIIPHQANIRILASVARHMKLPMERFYVNLDRFGNTSAASVPIALSQASEEGRLHEGMKLLLVGFGGGLTYAASLIEL
ncbi:MAG: 3-oxoacyl-[acyl-carrier-protein] synthase III C-terminal domain-containing protein [Merdibacter sp.]